MNKTISPFNVLLLAATTCVIACSSSPGVSVAVDRAINPPPTIPSPKSSFFAGPKSARSPIMRTHHGTHARFNHNLATNAETTAHWKRYANLHTRLFPYTRGQKAVVEGVPLWLPLGMVHPEDEQWNVLDQFFFGDKLLVAPIVEESARNRDVFFPSARYVSFFDESVVEGPATRNVDAAIDEIPVYIEAGGIIPLTKNQPLTLIAGSEDVPGFESTEGDREVFVALGASGVFVEESGATYTLTGSGTDANGINVDDEGYAQVVGNGEVCGVDFCLALTGHPESRTSDIRFK